jgi:HAD superfamily hydrolase (TIGR01509 family)
MNAYSVYVFDFDGTLADSREAIVSTVEGTLSAMGLPAVPAEAVVALIGTPLGAVFERLGVPASRVDEAVTTYRTLFAHEGERRVKLFAAAESVLSTLDQRGVFLAVASSRGRVSLDSLLARLAIAARFRIVVGEKDVANPKPHPEAVHKILAAAGARPEHALVIGDTTYDLEMGASAGVATCAVTYGSHGRDQLAACRPTHLVDRLADVLALPRDARA